MTSVLGHVLRHNAWANRTLLEHCAALGRRAGARSCRHVRHAVRNAPAPGGRRQFYIRLLTDEYRHSGAQEGRRALDDLIAISAKTGARAIDIAASDDPERVIGDSASDDWTTAGIVLAQLVNHGNEHRAHATTILGANGRTPPKIGAWSYGIANGISRNDGD